MRTLGIFAIAGGLVAVMACSSASPPTTQESNLCAKGDDCTSTKKEKKVTDDGTTLPPAPAPVAATPDAGGGSHDAGADSSTAPPTTTYCRDLNTCCGKLSGTEKFACIGVAILGKETPCRVELAVCSAGGIGTIGGGGGTECKDLTTCCNQMESEQYYDDAADCRGHLSGNNAGVCSSWLTEYRDLNWCR